MSNDNNSPTEMDLHPVLQRWAADEESRSEPPLLDELNAIAHGRTLRRRALALGGVAVVAGFGLWFSIPQLLDSGNGLTPAGDTNYPSPNFPTPDPTDVNADEYIDGDEVPLLAVEPAGVPMIVMAENPSGMTEERFEGELVQDPTSGCLMMQRGKGSPQGRTETTHIVWPVGTTVEQDDETIHVVFSSGHEIALGDTFIASGSIDAEAVSQNLDTQSPCTNGEPLLTYIIQD